MQHHLEKWETSGIMKDDIYVFILGLKWTKVGNSTSESVILWGKLRNNHHAAAGGVGVCSWIKFSNSWHKQLFQMSQYLLGNNTFSPRTTFVNETNTFYQHVDRSPPIWLRGPHKGSQAKLQYFSKRPLGFLPPIIIWMLSFFFSFFWRSSICILMLCPCSI